MYEHSTITQVWGAVYSCVFLCVNPFKSEINTTVSSMITMVQKKDIWRQNLRNKTL